MRQKITIYHQRKKPRRDHFQFSRGGRIKNSSPIKIATLLWGKKQTLFPPKNDWFELVIAILVNEQLFH